MGSSRQRITSALVAVALSTATVDVARAEGRAGFDPGRAWAEAERHARAAREVELDRPERAAELYLDAAQLFEAVARERPDFAPAYWRGARGFWMSGDTLPVEAKRERIARFGRAESLAATGIEVDPECAECMLWKFASMGRLRTTRGIWTSVRQLPEMAALLDRGIALAPTHADDGEDNSTLGNLHYSSAIFYRVFPDWFWIGWALGVKGDKERALGHIRTALALQPTRLDYQIELGSQLLCLGSVRGDGERLAEGARALRSALLREAETQDDARELAAARVMLAEPRKACTYSGDTWVEIDREQALHATSASSE